jgi:hypothetical protein
MLSPSNHRRQGNWWYTVYVNWALFFSIGLQCMCIEQVKTETNLSCLNKKNCLVKLKNFSCVFMSSAWTNMWGSPCQSFCLFYSFFQCLQYNITKHIYMNNRKKCHIFSLILIEHRNKRIVTFFGQLVHTVIFWQVIDILGAKWY